jgi:hypothetical protein
VVVTSSCAAVLQVEPEPKTFSELDWNKQAPKEVEEMGREASPITKYRASKTLAERGACRNWFDSSAEQKEFSLSCMGICGETQERDWVGSSRYQPALCIRGTPTISWLPRLIAEIDPLDPFSPQSMIHRHPSRSTPPPTNSTPRSQSHPLLRPFKVDPAGSTSATWAVRTSWRFSAPPLAVNASSLVQVRTSGRIGVRPSLLNFLEI